MKKADIPPAPRRGHGSSKLTLKQNLDRAPGMCLFQEEKGGGAAETVVVHRTSSVTRNFFGSLSGLRQLAIKSSGSWLIRDMSVPAGLNGLNTKSYASSFGSVNRFGSALDLTGLIGLEEEVVGSQSSNFIFFRSQLDSGSRRNSLRGDLTPPRSRRNSLEGFIPRQCDHGDDTEQFALEGADRLEECNRADLRSVELVQACARRMLCRKQYQAMVKGASTFQHVWRARQELRVVAVVRIQSYYRRWKCRKLFKAVVDKIVYIQSCARRMLGRKHYQEDLQLVVKIQRAWRAFNARQKHQQEFRIAAAVRIQSHYERWKWRKSFKTLVGRAVYIQACARRMLAKKPLQSQVTAALTIRQAWGNFSACQHSQELETVAAVRIQSYYRGWQRRKLFKLGRVVFIQSCARRMLARRHYQAMVKAASTFQQVWRTFNAQQKHKQELELVAVVKIQFYYRGWRSRKLAMMNRVVRLQSFVRRMLARKHYQAMVKGASTIQHAWHARQKHLQELKIVAVVRIQSCCRGWKTRKIFKGLVGRAVYIQACARRTLATRRYKELRRGTIVLQRRWRKFQRLQVEDKAASKIQSRWRSYKRHQLYQSLRQHRVDCAGKIQRRWRVLQILRLEKERAVILIQAHFRARRVRTWFKKTHRAVTCIEFAYLSYAQRRTKNERQYLGCEQSLENISPMIFLKKSTLCGSNDSLNTFSPKSSLSVVNPFVLANEMHNSDCGYMSSQCSLMKDWNNIPIDEVNQCLDTCLAASPLSAVSSISRQRSLEPSGQCLLTLDVVPSRNILDQSDVSSAPATPVPASFRSSEVEQDLVEGREVYGGAARNTIQSGSEICSTLHGFYPSSSQKLLVDEELAEQGQKPSTSSTSKDEERLQHFAEIFLTMRQISLQQQRAQCAPPFPPSLAVPPQSPPVLDPGAKVSSRTSIYASPMVLALTPALNTGRSEVVLNMEELLKTLEQYCEESGGCDMVTEGVIESGHNWRVRKTTSTPTLGLKHLKLPDVNAVLIVLVAMVVYTRTVCREVFFGTRQSPRKK